MIFISSRSDLRESDYFGDTEEFFDVPSGMRGTGKPRKKSFKATQAALKSKRILLLIHGYNREFDSVSGAFSAIEENINNLQHDYDRIVGYTWPGGDEFYEYSEARGRASSAANRLAVVVNKLAPETVDIMTHSLGGRVALKAAMKMGDDPVLNIRNHFAMATAVDNEAIEHGEVFYESTQNTDTTWIFHSKYDNVLRFGYRLAEQLETPLGLHGPEDKVSIQNHSKNVKVINCKQHVRSHGAYKRTPEVYQFVNDILISKHSKKQQFFNL